MQVRIPCYSLIFKLLQVVFNISCNFENVGILLLFDIVENPTDNSPPRQTTCEEETAKRLKLFAPFQVNRALLDLAAEDVLFMHCLPAHRGEEISYDLLDDPRAVVWHEAENRLHAQKALMEFLLKDKIRLA